MATSDLDFIKSSAELFVFSLYPMLPAARRDKVVAAVEAALQKAACHC
jgi:hypothetical protein